MGRSSRERRMRRRAAAERAASAPSEARRRRTLLRAAIIAAIVGLAAGWLVRLWVDRSPESSARETTESVRERVREQTR